MDLSKLREYGANVDEGMGRCLNNESFYLMLVDEALKDTTLLNLEGLIKEKNFKEAFELTHALKGMYGNLSITPLFNAVATIVEPLRRNEDIDYTEMIKNVMDEFNRFQALQN